MEHNPYAPPTNHGPTPQPAMPTGPSDMSTEEVLREAWRLTDGFKALAWGAFIVVGIVSQIAATILATVTVDAGTYMEEQNWLMFGLTTAWQGLILLPVTAPLNAGLAMLALQRVQGRQPEIGTVFGYFGQVVPLIGAGALVSVAAWLGLALLVIPGIYISVGLSFAAVLVVDRDLGPMEACQMSLAVVHRRWWHVFVTILVTGLLVGLSALPLGIGLIWTVPWQLLVVGVLYRSLFGVQSIPAGEQPGMAY